LDKVPHGLFVRRPPRQSKAARTYSYFTTSKALLRPTAKSKLPIITVSEIDVKDMEAYKQWLPPVQKGIADAGGKYLAGGFNKTTTLIGAPPPNRVVIIQYPDPDSWKKWWTDRGEKDIKSAEKFASFRIYGAEGIESK
jgi:uncharacterized protein (DUF1330 family)